MPPERPWRLSSVDPKTKFSQTIGKALVQPDGSLRIYLNYGHTLTTQDTLRRHLILEPNDVVG
jgi:hypothetical protein